MGVLGASAALVLAVGAALVTPSGAGDDAGTTSVDASEVTGTDGPSEPSSLPAALAPAAAMGAPELSGGDDPHEPLSPPATAAPAEPVDIDPLEPVTVAEPADFGNGLVAVVTEVEAVDVEAARLGETAGPAAAVHLEVRNESDVSLDLDGLAVNAEGPQGIPLVPNFMPPTEALSGVLEPGDSAAGIYVFRLDGDIDAVTVQVHHNTTPNFVVIQP